MRHVRPRITEGEFRLILWARSRKDEYFRTHLEMQKGHFFGDCCWVEFVKRIEDIIQCIGRTKCKETKNKK